MNRTGKDWQKRVAIFHVTEEKLNHGICGLPEAAGSLLKIELRSESVFASLACAFIKK